VTRVAVAGNRKHSDGCSNYGSSRRTAQGGAEPAYEPRAAAFATKSQVGYNFKGAVKYSYRSYWGESR